MISPWIETFNLSVIPNEERPDKPSGDIVYRLVDLFTTRNGCWEPSDKPGATPLWAREKYLRPLGAIDFFSDAGAEHHLFTKVLDVNGRPLKNSGLVRCWSDGLKSLGNTNYNRFIDVTPKMGSGWAAHHIYDGFRPGRGERGRWCWCPQGAADVVVGGGLPDQENISYFAVWQAEASWSKPTAPTLAPAMTHRRSAPVVQPMQSLRRLSEPASIADHFAAV